MGGIEVESLFNEKLMLLRLKNNLARPLNRYIKTMFDFVVTLVGAILISPLLLFIALWIYKDSPGPVIFKHMRIGKNQEQINRYLGKSFSYVWLVGFPITFGIFAVADTFVPFFFGVGYEPVIRLLCLFSLIIIPIGISNIVGLQYLVTTGNEYYLTKSVVLGAIVNFGLNMLFIRWWQATGATLASVITEVIIMVFQLWVVRDFLPVVDYMKSMKNYLVAAIVMYVVLILMPIYFDKAIFLLMSKVIFGSIIYLICLLGMKDSFFREIIGKVIGMASKKKARDRV